LFAARDGNADAPRSSWEGCVRMSQELTQRSELARAKHQQALELMDKQHLEGALRLFGEALAQEETCERWNDWRLRSLRRISLRRPNRDFDTRSNSIRRTWR
jgi:hypothetical protein